MATTTLHLRAAAMNTSCGVGREGGTMAVKAYAYSRFSYRAQKAGGSLGRQDEMARQAAQVEGVELDDSLRFTDLAISAMRGQNRKKGDLGKFLDLVHEGVIPRGSVLIIEQVNR